MKTVTIAEELAQVLGPDERVPGAFTEAALLELYRERRISAGRAAELLGLSYRGFLALLQKKRIPVVTTPPRDREGVLTQAPGDIAKPHEAISGQRGIVNPHVPLLAAGGRTKKPVFFEKTGF